MWWADLAGGELYYAFIYGVVSAGLLTGSYAALTAARKRHRDEQLRVRPYRSFPLRLGR